MLGRRSPTRETSRPGGRRRSTPRRAACDCLRRRPNLTAAPSLSAQVEALHEREYRPPFNPRACTEQRAAVLECYQRMSGQPAGEVCSALRRRPARPRSSAQRRAGKPRAPSARFRLCLRARRPSTSLSSACARMPPHPAAV